MKQTNPTKSDIAREYVEKYLGWDGRVQGWRGNKTDIVGTLCEARSPTHRLCRGWVVHWQKTLSCVALESVLSRQT